jgi:hypothetical protein
MYCNYSDYVTFIMLCLLKKLKPILLEEKYQFGEKFWYLIGLWWEFSMLKWGPFYSAINMQWKTTKISVNYNVTETKHASGFNL